MENETTIYQVSVLAAALSTPRFKGRAELLKAAQAGNKLALRLLEAGPREREIAVRRGGVPGKWVSAMGLQKVVAECEERRTARQAAKRENVDRLAARRSGNVLKRAVLALFDEALADAGFRKCNEHQTTVRFVQRGQEGVSSSTESEWASSMGYSKAYCRKAYRVTISHHEWRVSPAIFDARRQGKLADDGRLRLVPGLIVRQGRGSGLVYLRQQRRSAGKEE